MTTINPQVADGIHNPESLSGTLFFKAEIKPKMHRNTRHLAKVPRVILKFRKKVEDDCLLDRERQNLLRFRSPYIRALVDVPAEKHNGTPFLVLEHMDVSLSDMWKCQQEPPFRTMIVSLLHALNMIHTRNYVHTDIEPRNILLSKVGTPDMEVKLADFENVYKSPNDFPIQPLAFVRIRFHALLLDLRSPDIDEFRRKIMYLTKMKRLFGLNNPWPDAFLKSDCADDLGLVDSLVAQTKTPSLECFLASRNGSEVEIDFATRMLQIDPTKRWTAEQLLSHRWVTS
ncbi:hypothetical protein HL42_1717 [Trichophyton rubrum]|nr:hypothetical protein HL42_1717 [Trichophyton rubrum]